MELFLLGKRKVLDIPLDVMWNEGFDSARKRVRILCPIGGRIPKELSGGEHEQLKLCAHSMQHKVVGGALGNGKGYARVAYITCSVKAIVPVIHKIWSLYRIRRVNAL